MYPICFHIQIKRKIWWWKISGPKSPKLIPPDKLMYSFHFNFDLQLYNCGLILVVNSILPSTEFKRKWAVVIPCIMKITKTLQDEHIKMVPWSSKTWSLKLFLFPQREVAQQFFIFTQRFKKMDCLVFQIMFFHIKSHTSLLKQLLPLSHHPTEWTGRGRACGEWRKRWGRWPERWQEGWQRCTMAPWIPHQFCRRENCRFRALFALCSDAQKLCS